MPAFVNILTALGWSLLDSIWQMAAVWTAYFILTADNKRISAAGKHNLALMFVAIGSGWSVYSFVHILNRPVDPILSGFIPFTPSINHWIPYLSLVYLLILIQRLLQYGFLCRKQNRNKSGKSVSPVLQSFADRHARLMGISRRVNVCLCDLADTAETSGFLRPLILIPVSLVTLLSPQQLEAILVHELFHIRRNDYLINMFMSCFRAVFFFNPFAYFFYKAIAQERELACDDGVLEREYPPALYAEALFCLEKFRQVEPGLSLAADGNKPWLLMERIRRVLGKPALKKNQVSPLIFFSLAAACVAFGLQHKTSIHDGPVQVTANHSRVTPIRYEFVQEKINVPGKEITVRPTPHRKQIKKQASQDLLPPAIPDQESAWEPDPPNQAFFAENNVLVNFSNQQAIDMNQELIKAVPGTPYVPSVTLSYEALPEVMATDSLRDILILDGLKEITTLSCLKEIASLNRLSADIETSRKQLKQEEIKNRELILLDQKNIKPLLENFHRQIQLRKKKIDRLRIRLQVSEEEIIHI
jgi:Zn-dependent protease with chaperone function